MAKKKKTAQQLAWAKNDTESRTQVVSSIRVSNDRAPEILRQIEKISKKHDGKKTVAILAAIEEYAKI